MLFLAYHPRLRLHMVYFLVFLTLVFTYGCFRNYFQVNKMEKESFQEMVTVGQVYKYFIVHVGDAAWRLDEVSIGNYQLQGKLQQLDPERVRPPANPKRSNRYRTKENYVLQEVHIYLEDWVTPGDVEDLDHFSVPLTSVKEIHLYEPDKGATTLSYVMGTLGIVLTTAVLIAATSDPYPKPQSNYEGSSCPYVYAFNGQVFGLVGESFGGAILPQLERSDFMPLPAIHAVDSEYRVRMSNELRERQRINLARLVVVDHPANCQVLADQQGEPYTIEDPQPANSAIATGSHDVRSQLLQADNNFYYFFDGEKNRNEVVLGFQCPEQAETGKLILRANATYWADLVYGEYTRQFGIYYENWMDQLRTAPVDKLQNWMRDQLIPLTVYLEMADGWQEVEEILPVGPLAPREFIVPVDLREHSSDQLRIKLSTGSLFWQLDYAAMDFSPGYSFSMTELAPKIAVGSDGLDYTSALAEADEAYVRQEKNGQQVEIRYSAPACSPDNSRTVFLHTQGYYEHIRSYDGFPDLIELRKFRNKEHFVDFSQERFKWFLEANGLDETLFAGDEKNQR